MLPRSGDADVVERAGESLAGGHDRFGAIAHLPQCDRRRLDGDRDGIPCETLCRYSREIAAQDAFEPFRGAEQPPWSEARADTAIDQLIRETAESAYHP